MDITKSEKKIIHTATVAAGVVCASPIPFSDAALLIPIQIAMIAGLYKKNGLSISKGVIKGALKASIISGFGKSLSGNLLKFIPVVGTVTGGVINAGVAVGFTEFLGFSIAKELHGTDNVDILDLTQIISDVMKNFAKV